ncbi:unnamed protein product [Heterobilharzia americana]|nr:unnamed protein product [Heterobilharzia americana]CAH8537533.1 unnamed protein product [Heterobilharzia americana]
MHIPKRSILNDDKTSLENWQNYCLNQPYLSNENQFITSYSTNYQLKQLDEPTKLRPTSANRRHKPQSSSLLSYFTEILITNSGRLGLLKLTIKRIQCFFRPIHNNIRLHSWKQII